MYATEGARRVRAWRKGAGMVIAVALAMTTFGGTVQGANSRIFSVTVSDPSAVSQGGATKVDITVQSSDNQTIANVRLSVPAVGQSWPSSGVTITTVFGPNASMCAPTNGTSLSCDFGNLAGGGNRKISVLATVATSVPTGSTIVFSASAETNNENGSNQQIQTDTSGPLTVLPFSANSLTTANLAGSVFTSALGTPGAGNLRTTLNLLQNNGGLGNAIVIAEGTSATQPAYCVSLKLTCQPDFTDITVNNGASISPYLETVLTAQVPKKFNIKKAFVIHVLSNGSVDPGFPLFNVASTSCAAHPELIPCADFSISNTNVLTILIHTFGNGKFNY